MTKTEIEVPLLTHQSTTEHTKANKDVVLQMADVPQEIERQQTEKEEMEENTKNDAKSPSTKSESSSSVSPFRGCLG